MDVAYTNGTDDQSFQRPSVITYRRNIEVGIGCACVQSQPKRIEQFIQMVVEKRGDKNARLQPDQKIKN